jgi:hypothetical protein
MGQISSRSKTGENDQGFIIRNQALAQRTNSSANQVKYEITKPAAISPPYSSFPCENLG